MKVWCSVMGGWARLLTIVVLAVVAGCGDDGPTGQGGLNNGGEITTAEPPVEPTGPEPPQPTQDKPAVRVASLPIGGNPSVDGLRQCAEVNWLGASPIPDDITVSIDTISLDPEGTFRLDQESCGSDRRSCAERGQIVDSAACYVGVTQVAAGDEGVQLVIAGTVTCARLPDCEDLVGPSEGSQISLQPEPFEPSPEELPSEMPPASPAESPFESPIDSPGESATD